MRTGLSALIVLLLVAPACAYTESQFPDRASFRTGDLIWPKRPGDVVLYEAGAQRTPEQDKQHWLSARDTFLQSKSNGSSMDVERRDALESMEYREFLAIYAGNEVPGRPGVYRGGGLYVGHVAIVEVENGQDIWVIEAVLDNGVVRTKYDDWLEGRSGQIVWHGRVKNLPDGAGDKIVAKAKDALGKPFDFWNFDLNDDAGFYCSKLVWQAIYRALDTAIDGNDNPKRRLWFSPKQLMNLDTIEMINNPGKYAP